MGRRSRKRLSSGDGERPLPAPAVDRVDARPARPRPTGPKARREDAPDAPWGTFPLVELCIFVGIVLGVWGLFFSSGEQADWLVGGGVGLICLASLELVVREHLAGFRSHTTLLSVACAVPVMAVLYLVKAPVWTVAASAAIVGGLAWTLLRRVFVRRADGLGFRA
jgi:hypothetical protein